MAQKWALEQDEGAGIEPEPTTEGAGIPEGKMEGVEGEGETTQMEGDLGEENLVQDKEKGEGEMEAGEEGEKSLGTSSGSSESSDYFSDTISAASDGYDSDEAEEYESTDEEEGQGESKALRMGRIEGIDDFGTSPILSLTPNIPRNSSSGGFLPDESISLFGVSPSQTPNLPPSTLHPPFTLHPAPSALHPPPSTLLPSRTYSSQDPCPRSRWWGIPLHPSVLASLGLGMTRTKRRKRTRRTNEGRRMKAGKEVCEPFLILHVK
jgi:hypothetical protein